MTLTLAALKKNRKVASWPPFAVNDMKVDKGPITL